jgi:peptide-methionine (R)-S-oxide reductase
MARKVVKSDAEWRAQLTPQQYEIVRNKGTERAFTGKYWDHHEDGTYTCVACGEKLFDSQTKFESGSGWPSFYQPIDESHVETEHDASHGMQRTEVHCASCSVVTFRGGGWRRALRSFGAARTAPSPADRAPPRPRRVGPDVSPRETTARRPMHPQRASRTRPLLRAATHARVRSTRQALS